MLASFIDAIRNLARAADGVQIATHDSLPEKVILRHGDKYETVDVPPRRRAHVVHGYSDIIAAATDQVLGAHPEIWHDGSGIYMYPERDDRRDGLVLVLQKSDRFKTLESLHSGRSQGVRDTIRMLRFELHGTGIEVVVRGLSKIDFARKSDGRVSVEHGKESMGRSIESAVQQVADIPEEFSVATSIYVNPGLRELTSVLVRCGIYLDMNNEQIEIRVLADELNAAENSAQAAVGKKLRGDLPGVPVFHGRP